MNNQTIQERVIALINETERLSTEISNVEKGKLDTEDKALSAFNLFAEWYESARQAIHFCRLAILSLTRDDLESLIARVQTLPSQYEDIDLWEWYTLAEWYDDAQFSPDW